MVFFYWPWYKNGQQTADGNNIKDYGGYQIKSLYVTAKFSSLKEEIYAQQSQKVEWESVMLKAEGYIQTYKAKQIRAQDEEMELHYGIEKDTDLSIQNIIAIILYCNYSELCTVFSETFRAMNAESLKVIRDKHRHFWWWAKILRETVEYFGNNRYGRYYGQQFRAEIGPFYCGVNALLVMPEFNIGLCSPTSTSKQREIGLQFAGEKGALIQFNNNGDSNAANLRSFDCSWISQHSNEDERLFMGGHYKIRIESLILINMNSYKNYSEIFHALFWFDCLLNGSRPFQSKMDKQLSDCVNNKDRKWISKLIDDQLNGMNRFESIDSYPYDTFGAFCENKKSITLNIDYIKLYYLEFYDLIKANVLDQLIFNIFANVTRIVIYTTSNDGQTSYPISLTAVASKLYPITHSENAARNNVDIEISVRATQKYDSNEEWIGQSWLSEEWNLVKGERVIMDTADLVRDRRNAYSLKEDEIVFVKPPISKQNVVEYVEDFVINID